MQVTNNIPTATGGGSGAAPEGDEEGVQGQQHRRSQGPLPQGTRGDLEAQQENLHAENHDCQNLFWTQEFDGTNPFYNYI